MPAGIGGDEALVGIQVEPGMLQLIEVLDIPIPPDGVFDGGRRAGGPGRFGAGKKAMERLRGKP